MLMFNIQEFPGYDSFLGLAGGREGVLVVWQIDTGKKKFLPRIGSPLLYFVDSPDPSLASVRKKLFAVLHIRVFLSKAGEADAVNY